MFAIYGLLAGFTAFLTLNTVQDIHSHPAETRVEATLPVVLPNDNRHAAGLLANERLERAGVRLAAYLNRLFAKP